MARIKVPRKSTALDMTAMCDVAFLLLTFFILTAKLRQEDPLHIDTPSATTVVLVPDDNIATLSIGHNKVFFGTKSKPGPLYKTVESAIDIWSSHGKVQVKVTPDDLINYSFVNE